MTEEMSARRELFIARVSAILFVDPEVHFDKGPRSTAVCGQPIRFVYRDTDQRWAVVVNASLDRSHVTCEMCLSLSGS